MAAELTMAAEKHPLPSWTAPKSPHISSARGESRFAPRWRGLSAGFAISMKRLPVRLPEVFVGSKSCADMRRLGVSCPKAVHRIGFTPDCQSQRPLPPCARRKLPGRFRAKPGRPVCAHSGRPGHMMPFPEPDVRSGQALRGFLRTARSEPAALTFGGRSAQRVRQGPGALRKPERGSAIRPAAV
jgi:hypothetical protein